MAKSIEGLDPITAAIRANYALAIESLTDAGEDTKRFGLDLLVGKNVRPVSSMEDFPAESGGVITTEAGVSYGLAGNLETANRFVISEGSEIFGYGPGASSLKYTGGGDMFTVTDINFEIREFKIDLNGTGTLVSGSSASGFNFFVSSNMMITGAAKLGTLTGMSLSTTNTNILDMADGWSTVGTIRF